MKNNDYGQGSEHDDAPIYERAWIYRQENQEMQNLTFHDLKEIDRARDEYKPKHHGNTKSNKRSS